MRTGHRKHDYRGEKKKITMVWTSAEYGCGNYHNRGRQGRNKDLGKDGGSEVTNQLERREDGIHEAKEIFMD